MDKFDLRGFNLFPTKVTFESITEQEVPEGERLPRISVGYKGKKLVTLYQWVNDEPHKDGCTKGQWWTLAYTPDNPKFQDAINKMVPMGQPLEELKANVIKIIKEHYGD
jgi:hypothetical protein